jgi:hypothetical protein
MRQAPRIVFFLLALFLIAVIPGVATTVNPPQNLGQIARVSRAIVLAEALGSRSELRGKLPHTITTFRVLQSVAGENLGRTFQVDTKGGAVGEAGYKVPGTPSFAEGGRYLLFLDPGANGTWRLKMASYGILEEVAGTGLLRPVPEAAELDVLTRPGIEGIDIYREKDLLTHLAAVHDGAPWHREASMASAEDLVRLAAADKSEPRTKAIAGDALTNAPAACRFLSGTDGSPLRWFGFETGGSISIWHTTPGQTGISDGGVAAVQEGAAAWTNHNTSAIRMLYAGSKGSSADCSDGIADVLGEVTFNDPCDQIPALAACSGTPPPGWLSTNCCGTVAEYGYTYNAGGSPITRDGELWRQMTGQSVVVNDGSQCLGETDFKEMMTHFLGHGLGFGHHNDSDATMYVNLGVHPPRGAALGTTDKTCASYAYHTFLDVPYNHFAWRFIESVRINGVSSGCGSGNFCPDTSVTRGSMAVLLLLAKEGGSYVPPACTTPTFSDVPCSDPLAPWVEELVRRGVTAGCGNGQYCPNNIVTREQIAVFLLKTLEGPSYIPASCTTPPFNDVPCSSPFASWVRELVARGITAGCGNSNYCPQTTLNRAQISVFLVTNFRLPLP